MKRREKEITKELYGKLRALSCEQLWNEEVPRFDQATPEERAEMIGLIRAVGVVFSESGTATQREAARQWLRGLLRDPIEKVRRYAMTALPKLGGGPAEEAELLALLQTTGIDREKKFLGRSLEKVGGAATLQHLAERSHEPLKGSEQKLKAAVAREQITTIRTDLPLDEFANLRIHLRGRRGLETVVREEVQKYVHTNGRFRVDSVHNGVVVLEPILPFTLGDLYSLRCFGTVGFVASQARAQHPRGAGGNLATMIASPWARRLLKAFTHGPLRYRIEFVSKGHQRAAVRSLAGQVHALAPELLNDAQEAPWVVEVHSGARGEWIAWSPRLVPDPRFAYRQRDVPAASHPPLAASMARLAGKQKDDVVWDPFCGSGLELIERALLGGVKMVFGTDLSAEAIGITERNLSAAKIVGLAASFAVCDFRDFATVKGLGTSSVTLIISNPPMGKRVPIGDVRRLIEELLEIATKVLKPGGRLVFVNPVNIDKAPSSLRLASRQTVDMGGFDCRVEMYRKS